jgi:threonine synthase
MAKGILYQSTNRHLDTPEISGFKGSVPFAKALFMGQAPDGGLFMPARIPKISKSEILALKGKHYHEVAYEILGKFLAGEIPAAELKTMTREAYDFGVPIDKMSDHDYLARLDRGPTASFKDFAARMMARLMQRLKPEKSDITVLVATSGDTGSAIGEAYKGLDGIRVFILYPEYEVSPVQKRQLDSIGGNVQSVAIEGKFDDCQRLVKEAFTDPDLMRLNLTSANSINIGRILSQIVYYFYSYASVAENMEPAVFSVPSGNFGNSLGCEFARRMGLPVERIIIATNENDEFPRFLESGVYRKLEPSRKCLSNAMNVGNPSNLARYFDLYGGILDKDGVVHKKPDLGEMRRRLFSVAVSDRETIETIRRFYNERRVLLEPHGAVGVAALMKYPKDAKGGNHARICIETAHPAKFPEIIRKELGIEPEVPPSLAGMAKRKGKPDRLANDYAGFKKYLLQGVK